MGGGEFMNDDRWHLGLTDKKMKSALEIHGSAIRFEYSKEKPNPWWRFWQWVLLGWKWIDL